MTILPFPTNARTARVPQTTPTSIDEPSVADLAAIEAEQPLIDAEIRLLEAEWHVFYRDHRPTELDWRRLRRAQARVAEVSKTLHTASQRVAGWVA